MKWFLAVAVFGLIFLTGCGKRADSDIQRRDIIDREKMIMLMADLDITEAALRVKQTYIPRDSLSKLTKLAYDSLYIYYNTTPVVFKENLKYYQLDMEDYYKMVEEKIELLVRKKDSVALAPEKLDTTKRNITGGIKREAIDQQKTKTSVLNVKQVK